MPSGPAPPECLDAAALRRIETAGHALADLLGLSPELATRVVIAARPSARWLCAVIRDDGVLFLAAGTQVDPPLAALRGHGGAIPGVLVDLDDRDAYGWDARAGLLTEIPWPAVAAP